MLSRTAAAKVFNRADINYPPILKYLCYIEYAGDPTNNVTPEFIGQVCRNSATGIFYVAKTAAAAGWAALHS